MPRSLGATALSLLALTLFVAACGGASAAPTKPASTDTPAATEAPAAEPDPTPGTTLNACEIVTPDDVKAAFEVDGDVPAGTLEVNPTIMSPGHTECSYQGDYGGVSVALTPEDGANLYDAARGSYKFAVDITGTGADGAFVSTEQRRAFVWKGAVTVMLTMADPTYEEAESFAKAIVAKL